METTALKRAEIQKQLSILPFEKIDNLEADIRKIRQNASSAIPNI